MSRVFYDINPYIVPLIRKAAGLSQEEFAHKLGVSVPTVQKWEQGRATPRGKNFRILVKWAAKKLGVGRDAVLKEPVSQNFQ
jgi:DNA-binding transcriptional regulator YiaG